MLPPRIVRRLVFAPLLLVLTLAALITLPAWLLVVTVASLPLPAAERRNVKLLWFAMMWMVLESGTLVASLGLWVAGGFGGRLHLDHHQERHYRLIAWFLTRAYRMAVRIFGLTITIDEPDPTPEELSRRLANPVIVLSRHAGPGDSFLLVYHLLTRYGRRPRIVMKSSLQYDPSLDIMINRLPNAFVPRKVAEGKVTAEIRRLAENMDHDDALVIFPEGGNFTPVRRWRAIRRLEARGDADAATRARAMRHLLAPRTGGALAAIEACPTADVIFVAHTGLDDLITIGDIWRHLPAKATITAKWWRVPAADIPTDRESRTTWLYDHWHAIDTWVAANRPTSRIASSDLP